MSQQKPYLLWCDVPPQLRMTATTLRHSGGAATIGESWVQLDLSVIDAADRRAVGVCRAAVLWPSFRLYTPCRLRVAPGEIDCSRHGGRTCADIRRREAERRALAQHAAREEHAAWATQGLALARALQRQIVERLHERALTEKRS